MQLIALGTPDMIWGLNYNKFDEDTKVIKEWVNEYRLILDADRNKDCPVTMEPINHGETYCICSECKYNFSEFAIDTIAKNKFNFDCPICRTVWSDFTYYKNENAEEESGKL